jgi:hypothetical protein
MFSDRGTMMEELVVPEKEDLEGLLQESLRELLTEAQRSKALLPPYGRPEPSLFMNPFPPEQEPETVSF